MVTAIAPPPQTTPDQYLEQEINSDIRHEYRSGEMIPMTGGTPDHNDISGNVYIALKLALRGQAYRTFHLDQRLAIPDRNLYTYPDVMVLKKPITLLEGRTDTVLNPRLIVEVLSTSTQDYDHGAKFSAYRTIAEFQEYLLIDQYQICVEHYVKTNVNQWLLSEYTDADVTLQLQSVDCSLQIAEIYEGIEF
ncbi:MAG: Uma2 family endonuclease [Cyanobacteria bacterium P01_G01_bin.54]